MNKLLVIDTESGGLDPLVHSILSLAGVVWEDGEITDEYEVLIHEDPFVVTAQAMKVNRIDLVAHAEKAVPPDQALNGFRTFALERFAGKKVILAGHNLGHDQGFLRRLCRMTDPKAYDELFSHRSLDTASVLRHLHLAGKVPDTALSSTGGFEHFNIVVPEAERHTALGDARATARLLTRTVELIR